MIFNVRGKKSYYCEALIDADDIPEATKEFMGMDIDDMDYSEEVDSVVEEVTEDDDIGDEDEEG